MEDGENSEVLHRVDDESTNPSIREEAGPRLRDRERVATVSQAFEAVFLRVSAEVRPT